MRALNKFEYNQADLTAGHIPREYKGKAGPGWRNSYMPSWTAQSVSRVMDRSS